MYNLCLMATIKKPLKILYNEYHASIPSKNLSPQGGPLRFAQNFREFFLNGGSYELCPVIFSYANKSVEPFLRTTKTTNGIFTEVVYDSQFVRSSYKMDLTKKQLIEYFAPILQKLEEVFDTQQPDVVFLNGFSLSNWWLLYVAHKKKVPVVIQHAGIWKKEIMRSKDTFSATLRKTFYDMERDTINWCASHIFLNEFSRDVFINLYKIKKTSLFSSVVIPLPISLPVVSKTKKDTNYDETSRIAIGMVARWDSIKNHSAMLRLATSSNKPARWHMNTVVSQSASKSEFAKQYRKNVGIVEPMSPEKLTQFYESMDIVILPSNFDVSPTVAAESLLVGVPVIISDQVGWVDAFIKHGLKDHIVAPKISGTAFVDRIKTVLGDYKNNSKKYTALVSQIRKDHAPTTVFKQYATLFSSVARQH